MATSVSKTRYDIPVAHVVIPAPFRHHFDYRLPENIKSLVPGTRVKVPFGRRNVIGIVIGQSANTAVAPEKLQSIDECLDETNLFPDELYQLLLFASRYYHYPLGEVLQDALPRLLRQGRAMTPSAPVTKTTISISDVAPKLHAEQKKAVNTILAQSNKFNAFLLFGITGSGKTEVYLQVIQQLIKESGQALVLIPEISLTPQTLARFEQRFPDAVGLYHSQLTPKQRFNTWLNVRNGSLKIVVGTRSAIFLPFSQLKTIIVDEEHDSSFKQQDGFRYSARDLAVLRAKKLNLPIVLGSATPSLESLSHAKNKRYHLLTLKERAAGAKPPRFQLIEIDREALQTGFSSELLNAISDRLARKEQVLLFLNRRGYTPVYLCFDCKWVASCHRCDAKLTYHQRTKRLHCHYCNAIKALPQQCPDCDGPNLLHLGMGTERIEELLRQYFPEAKLVRIDRDSTRKKGSLQSQLEKIHQGEGDILIGTQMLAKGHHFPNVTLVGILNMDQALYSADYRAIERMGQLLLQVAGRAGRAEKLGTVLIQTQYPQHPLLHSLILEGYGAFAKQLLNTRKAARFPPFIHCAVLKAEASKLDTAMTFLQSLLQQLAKNSHIEYLGPAPNPMAKRAGHYRAQVLIRSPNRQALHEALTQLTHRMTNTPASRKVRLALDVDPADMF